MEMLTKQVSYLRGLAEGYKLDGDKDDIHRLILEIIECLDLVADEVEFLNTDFERLEEYVNIVDEDLADLELMFDDDLDYDEEDDDDLYIDDDWEEWDDEDFSYEEEDDEE